MEDESDYVDIHANADHDAEISQNPLDRESDQQKTPLDGGN